MRYPEEAHARRLHRALELTLASAPCRPAVTVTGGGVHWHCTAEAPGRSVEIHCFDVKGEAEYLVRFSRGETPDARGRTFARADVLRATGEWLGGASVADLHARHAFVDRVERQLRATIQRAHDVRPELARSTTTELKARYGEYELWCRAGDRACHTYHYGYEEHLRASFEWDECPMFELRAGDVEEFAALLELWLVDRAAPSAVLAKFPSVAMSKVAGYYEEGRPVEGEFILSWDSIEQFYREILTGSPDWQFLQPVLRLIEDVRAAGFERTLRAGQSLWTLILSRARRHGLREGQPHVWFGFDRQGGMTVQTTLGAGKKLRFDRIALNPAVRDLLADLAEQPID